MQTPGSLVQVSSGRWFYACCPEPAGPRQSMSAALQTCTDLPSHSYDSGDWAVNPPEPLPEHPGTVRQWESRLRIGKGLEGALCRGARPCQPHSPKQQLIVPTATKSPKDLPAATLSQGHSFSKGPPAWLLPAMAGHGGPSLAGGPGTSGPAENSQPSAWRRASEDRSQKLPIPLAFVCRCKLRT